MPIWNLELDFGQSEMSLKVMITYCELWQKILRFGIYIAYVLWKFENTLYNTKIVILTVISIYV